MKTKELKSGNKIPILGFGTWQLTEETCIEAVKIALEKGYRHIDTAEMYQNQKEVARGIQDSGIKRQNIFLTSKVWFSNLTKQDLRIALEKTLRELNTDYLDLYLIHWPNRKVDMSETLKAMDQAKNQGLIKSIGVSNFTINHLKDVLKAGVEISVNQVEFHPSLYQRALKKFMDEHGMLLTAYSPTAQGEDFGIDLIQDLAKKYRKTNSQIVLNWILSKDAVAIPRSKNPEHIEENLKALEFEMQESDLKKIDGLNLNNRLIQPDFADFDY
ncbi:MAG: aldo/keto reductase [Candidatus Moranbacteria bacterium]|nr:aldo/keto reductase [Candidatus Moranbacteria bacterium]